ncbi:hypothetical protein [Sphingobium sp. EP60837]|uniref:hypothetical protein n=1 Tax=Sphingobium sp. EP60837 TaxID=1855519 RepID=UPI0012E756EC|nr:hypothetical protein [Sphingobium sp. EP60837]
MTEVDEVIFEPVTLSNYKHVLFGNPLNFSLAKEEKIFQEDGFCNISVNHLTDWCVSDLVTLQIALYAEPTFQIIFNEPLIVQDASHPVVFEAFIATHRAKATLHVEFEDLDTGATTRHFVEFHPDFLGGTSTNKYQKVALLAPANSRNISTRVSIAYEGRGQRGGEFAPYVFLCDAKIYEQPEENNEINSQFTEEDKSFYWVRARTKARISEGQSAFLKYGSKFDAIMTKPIMIARSFFDDHFYSKKNKDIDFQKVDPYTHYLLHGRREFRNPNPEFSVREYYLRHPEVEAVGLDPLVHYANVGQKEQRSLGLFDEKINEIWRRTGKNVPSLEPDFVLQRAQDLMVPMQILDTRKLAVFVVPEHDAMSGGIYSMFSIANQARKMRRKHGYDVVVMTRPNRQGSTYLRNSSFQNSETILRFEQLMLFTEVSELQIHIPEYATVEFVRNLSPEMLRYLLYRDHLHVNILNQNTRLMPEADKFRDLRRISDSIGQSISHHAFFGQEWADRYDLPSLLLPAYTDLRQYPASNFGEKEDIIIYSLDDAPYKQEVLERLNKMGDYELIEIRDITFDTYMDLATRCRFSVSFGEGFDGYVAQPIYQGGIGLALYTDEFFPDQSYKKFDNFFSTDREMIDQIVPTIRRLETDPNRYTALNTALRSKWDELYNFDDYVARIENLMKKKYEILPGA